MERRNFANVAIDLISEISNPSEEWALKSQTAALVAEVFLIFLMVYVQSGLFHFAYISFFFLCMRDR